MVKKLGATKLGFEKRVGERVAQEKRMNRKLFLGFGVFIVAYCVLNVVGVSTYVYYLGGKTVGEAVNTAFTYFANLFAIFIPIGQMLPGLVVSLVMILGLCGLVIRSANKNSEKQRRAIVPLYRATAEIQIAMDKDGFKTSDGGFNIALTAVGYVLALDLELYEKCVRHFDYQASGLMSKEAERDLLELSATQREALQRFLSHLGDSLESAVQIRKIHDSFREGEVSVAQAPT